jgi:hypothetical protein
MGASYKAATEAAAAPKATSTKAAKATAVKDLKQAWRPRPCR